MWNRAFASQPPSRAPTMPTTVARSKPVRSPVSFSATMPTMAPRTIQAIMPIAGLHDSLLTVSVNGLS